MNIPAQGLFCAVYTIWGGSQQRWALFDLQQIRFKPMQIVKFDSGLVVYSIITEFFNINMAAAAQDIGQSQLTVGKKDFDAADTA